MSSVAGRGTYCSVVLRSLPIALARSGKNRFAVVSHWRSRLCNQVPSRPVKSATSYGKPGAERVLRSGSLRSARSLPLWPKDNCRQSKSLRNLPCGGIYASVFGSMPRGQKADAGAANMKNCSSHVQILGIGSDTGDTSPSVLLFFDQRRYLFNVGEGLQRFCVEYRTRLRMIHHVFLTRVTSVTAGGLPGMILTMADMPDTHSADKPMSLFGPPRLRTFINAVNCFVNVDSVGLKVHEFGAVDAAASPGGGSPRAGAPPTSALPSSLKPVHKDELVSITPVLLVPEGAGGASRDTLGGGGPDGAMLPSSSDSGAASGADRSPAQKRPRLDAGGAAINAGTASISRDRVASSSSQPPAPDPISVAYICRLGDIPGKFLPEKAKQLDIPPGPIRGRLCRGESVQLPDGRTIHPLDVMEPSTPGPVVLIVDCPSLAYVTSLTTSAHLNELAGLPAGATPGGDRKMSAGAGQGNEAYGGTPTPTSNPNPTASTNSNSVMCVVHLAPVEVLTSPAYRAWMACFAPHVRHITTLAGTFGARTVNLSSARLSAKLNLVHPQVFPLHTPPVTLEGGAQETAKGDAAALPEDLPQAAPPPPAPVLLDGTVAGENLLRFHLRPLAAQGLDRSLVPPPLDVAAVQVALVDDMPAVAEALRAMAARIAAGPLEQAERDIGQLAVAGRSGMDRGTNTAVLKEGSDGVGSPPRVDGAGAVGQLGAAGGAHPLAVCPNARDTLELVFLGTGAAIPSKYRNVTSLYIHMFDRGGMLCDAGEGTYGQLLRRYGLQGVQEVLRGLRLVWISHIHADHHAGLPHVLALRRQLLGPNCPLIPVIGPRPLRRVLDSFRCVEDLAMLFIDSAETTNQKVGPPQLIQRQPASTTSTAEGEGDGGHRHAATVLAKQRTLVPRPPLSEPGGVALLSSSLISLGIDRLESVEVIHCAQAFGLVLEGRLRGSALPGGPQGGAQQAGDPTLHPGLGVVGAEGHRGHGGHSPRGGLSVSPAADAVGNRRWKIALSGDTRPCPKLVERSRGATVLIHEATFENDMPEEALAKKHSMTREAIESGVAAGAWRTILTHFSQRYPKIPVVDEHYTAHTGIAFDLMTVNLGDLWLLPELLPPLQLMFAEEQEPSEAPQGGLEEEEPDA
eukprot:jgi/Mesvir1/28691/Mv11183-RA.1